MKHNMGMTDRIIRAVAAIVIAALYFGNSISGTTATLLGLLAVVFLVTSALGFCPLYLPFKFSTRKTENPA